MVEKIETISESIGNSIYYVVENYYGLEGKDYLVVTYSNLKGAYWFWDLKDKELAKSSSEDKKETLGTEFHSLHTDTSYKLKVREKCQKAYWYYGQDRETKYPKKLVYKYCSLAGKAPS